MARILSPPPNELASLPTPLNDGERMVLDALVRHLDDKWEVFVQPKLHTKEPDFVVAHPIFGATVIEVKAWNPDCYRVADGKLQVQDSHGWKPCGEQPRWQCHRYRQMLSDRFFLTPQAGRADFALARGAVVLPFHTTESARGLLNTVSLDEYSERYVRVYGGDRLESQDDVREIVLGSRRRKETPDLRMRPEYIARLRRHLSESEWISDRRHPLVLSKAARNIARNPDRAKLRRVRGPAGSGKTLGLAARAAELAKQGKSVLVLCFNITLPHLIKDLAARHCRDIGANHRRILSTHFHGFCLDVIDRAGVRPIVLDGEDDNGGSRFDWLFRQAKGIYESREACSLLPRFDVVLVDEGQDFCLEWWNFLRFLVCEPDGEMLLVADSTQDIYDRSSWTRKSKMVAAGFAGSWTNLEGSYRMPRVLVPLLADFARTYLSGEIDPPCVPPEQEQRALFGEAELSACERRWIQVTPSALADGIAKEVLRLLDAHEDLHPHDITFLVEEHRIGLAAAQALEEKGVDVSHIFTEADGRERRTRKMRFWGGLGGTKGCTVHSFKGWEARAVVAAVDARKGSHRLAYVAMSRVKADPSNRRAFLSVVCSDPRLAAFGHAFRIGPDDDYGIADLDAVCLLGDD
ncbi:NERD domain-containing protein [Myxococcota bacterium]|nr:NERD domain-containing protein [Myxococcota bacterium]